MKISYLVALYYAVGQAEYAHAVYDKLKPGVEHIWKHAKCPYWVILDKESAVHIQFRDVWELVREISSKKSMETLS